MKPLEIRDLSRNFGGVRAIAGVSLALDAGERRAIIGTNGAGKTTLFNERPDTALERRDFALRR